MSHHRLAIGGMCVQLTRAFWLTHLGASDQNMLTKRHSREDHYRLSQ
jgi:hypothetical protein